MSLAGKVCLVTGATRGIGKGIAVQLGQAGATVYITGRTKATGDARGSLEETAEQITARGGKCIAVVCDHSKDEDVKRLFEKIKVEQKGQLDLLVNNAYAAIQYLLEKLGKKFWDFDASEMWDTVNNVGLRNYYICTVYAARMMAERKRGLIIYVSSAGGLRYLYGVADGIGKAGVDRMAADCAVELKDQNVASISLWPGIVDTENLTDARPKLKETTGMDWFTDIESPEFTGMTVVRLFQDPNIMNKTGRVHIVAELALEYGIKDLNGKAVPSMRQVNFLLKRAGYMKLASVIPDWIKVPYWVVTLAGSKF